jgi:hypothetical protein
MPGRVHCFASAIVCIAMSACTVVQERGGTPSIGDYVALVAPAKRPSTPIKPTPPPEYWAAPSQDRLMKPWSQRLNIIPLNEDYPNGKWFEFVDINSLGFLAWSSNAHCFQTRYEVEVVRSGDPFTGNPNFSSQPAARCGINTECTELHSASLIPGSTFRIVPGGHYQWRGRIGFNFWGPIEIPSGNCRTLRGSGAWSWTVPVIQPKPNSGEDVRDLFGFQEQWLSVISTADDISVQGGVQEQNGWSEATRAKDGRIVSVIASDGGDGSIRVGAPIKIENVNYVRDGVIHFSARATEDCDHRLSLLLTDYENTVIRTFEMDRRVLSSRQVSLSIPISRSGFDLRSWLKQGLYERAGMAGTLAVVSECKTSLAGRRARIEYDQLALEMKAQTFFRRTDW